MRYLGRVGNSDNFNFRGVPSFLREALPGNTKKLWNVCTVMVLLLNLLIILLEKIYLLQ